MLGSGVSLPLEGRVARRAGRGSGGRAPTSGPGTSVGRIAAVPRTRVSFEMRQKARMLRVHATKAEALLWYELRELRTHGLKFRRQAPIGPYIVDFLCPSVRLVVEVDGDLHETGPGKRHDANRDAYLNSLGYVVLRIDEPDVTHSAWHVAQMVKEKAEHLIGDPSRPLRGHPPLKGEGNAGEQT